MAVFQSKYRELAFYVKGRAFAFSGGRFATDDEDVIAVLETLTDAVRIDTPELEPTEESPKPRAPRKSSAK